MTKLIPLISWLAFLVACTTAHQEHDGPITISEALVLQGEFEELLARSTVVAGDVR